MSVLLLQNARFSGRKSLARRYYRNVLTRKVGQVIYKDAVWFYGDMAQIAITFKARALIFRRECITECTEKINKPL